MYRGVFIEMIVLFHTLFRVTKYILTVISKSVICNTRSNGEQEKTQNVFSNETDYLMESEAVIEEGIHVRFFPPVYIQRYTAVKHILQDERWIGKIRKVVDFGCAEFGLFLFVKYLPGIQEVLSVDIDREILEHNCCRAAPLNADYLDRYQRSEPLVVHVLNGSIADKDPRLLGTDAVVCIELIEHLYPETLEEVPYTVFGYIQPLVAIFTTPNSDFNVLFPNLTGFRHPDHKFEWSRSQFEEWALNIITRYPAYSVKVFGVGKGPLGSESYGCSSQMAVFVKTDYKSHIDDADSRPQDIVIEAGESDLVYEEIRKYEFPYHVDNRTDDEKILQEAEYYIRVLAICEKYNTDAGICIPLQKILPRVEKWYSSSTSLKNILQDAGWEVFEEPRDNEAYVIYPYFDRESPITDSEGFDMEGQRLYLAEETEEDWDSAIVDDENRDIVTCSKEKECSRCSENESCEDQEDQDCKSHVVKSDVENVDLNVVSDKQIIHGKDNNTLITNIQQCNSASQNSVIVQEVGSSADEQTSSVSYTQTDSYNFDRHSRMDKNNSISDYSLCYDTLEDFKNGTHPCNEALMKHTLGDLEENTFSESSKKNEVFVEDLILDENPQYQEVLHSQTLNANSADFDKDSYSFDVKGRQSIEREFENMHLSVVPESLGSLMVHQKSSHSLCVGCVTPSTLESSQERSLVESCSLDEQNDKAVDSGYPNSYSVQDMDMDLTPEQVDEIYSESEEINSNSSSVESDSDSDEENNRDHNRLINNDGFLFNLHNELLYEPMVHAVENGDVANNNRDGEGNNAVAVVPLPVEPEIEDQIDHEFIPLLAAAEDFDNDNDLILPDVVEPFPHWLLNLIGLVYPGNGAGELHNYLQPQAPPVNVFPDEGLGNEEAVIHESDSSDFGEADSDFDGSNLGSDGLGAEDWDEVGVEVVVPGDIGGGGEPDSFQGQ